MTIIIDKNIPLLHITMNQQSEASIQVGKMELGDSILFPSEFKPNSVRLMLRNHHRGKKFVTRMVGDSCRVWRTV